MTRLAHALRQQANSCSSLGSPFMGQLLTILAQRLRPGTMLTDHLFNWPGDLSSSGHSLPLRLAGALHRLVLAGMDDALSAAYPPQSTDDEPLWLAVSGAMSRHGPLLVQWLTSPPQTNEVRRAAALIPAAHFLADRFDLPMMVSELGASAGLNLNWQHFRLDIPARSYGPDAADVVLTPEWSGNIPPTAEINVVDRRGVDLLPINTEKPDDRTRLLSYLWPDQPARMALTQNAMALPRAPVDTGDAIDWLANRLPSQKNRTLHLIYHTIAWQYFPAEIQLKGRQLIEKAGNSATISKPLAWFRMETDNNGPGAGLILRLWPGDQTTHMGRADFHGRWIDWQA